MIEFIIEYWVEVVFGIIMTLGGVIMKKFDNKLKKYDATQSGVQALLRNDIVQIYNEAMCKGYMRIYERENIHHMYKEYKVLGGNGVIEDLIKKISELPTDPPKED